MCIYTGKKALEQLNNCFKKGVKISDYSLCIDYETLGGMIRWKTDVISSSRRALKLVLETELFREKDIIGVSLALEDCYTQWKIFSNQIIYAIAKKKDCLPIDRCLYNIMKKEEALIKTIKDSDIIE